MSSINTNAAAMTALQTLSATNKNLSTTQDRIATGLRISEASHNAAYWSISTGMQSQNKALSTVQDTIGLGKAVVDVAYTGLSEAIELTKDILAKYVAQEQFEAGSAESDALQAEIDALIEQGEAIAEAAVFQGMNLLETGGDESFVVAYSVEDGVDTLDVDAFDLAGAFGGINDAATAQTELDNMIEAAGELGAAKIRLDSQERFTSKLMDAIDRGIGQLVDADMEQESARLSALQVQQQLGIQSLSIANSSAQNILSLFR
ncbi:MAG: flagellin N-terminal helical domain-containing protein [Rhizobiaceae bacterium]